MASLRARLGGAGDNANEYNSGRSEDEGNADPTPTVLPLVVAVLLEAMLRELEKERICTGTTGDQAAADAAKTMKGFHDNRHYEKGRDSSCPHSQNYNEGKSFFTIGPPKCLPHLRHACDMAIAQAVYKTGVAFHMIQHPTWKHAFDTVARAGIGYKYPSENDICNSLLHCAYEDSSKGWQQHWKLDTLKNLSLRLA
ncbi:hypothetical protein SELMODRAFT_431992 [Selaginella moellendorffii]|uniref:Uncharacterized protein n=1 Tax=Selaginella moellendorffii TaxID=88036 RepID=D8TEM3_SELML|nr:hypothetical protein SELMODRAFT_431992 [Selaginella moellendorffii]